MAKKKNSKLDNIALIDIPVTKFNQRNLYYSMSPNDRKRKINALYNDILDRIKKERNCK